MATFGLLVATSVGCADSRTDSRTCDVVHANAYRVEYSRASKDCVSEADVDLPTYIAVSYNLAAIMVNIADSITSADLVFRGCTANAQIVTQYNRSQLKLSLQAPDLDVDDDGSLHGVAELEVLDGETRMCSASIPIVLTPTLPDGGLLRDR